jgi:hypothetical protein
VTEKIGDLVIIEGENRQQCDLCGRIDELRPYGPNREKICFDCAMSTPELKKAAEQRFKELLGG